MFATSKSAGRALSPSAPAPAMRSPSIARPPRESPSFTSWTRSRCASAIALSSLESWAWLWSSSGGGGGGLAACAAKATAHNAQCRGRTGMSDPEGTKRGATGDSPGPFPRKLDLPPPAVADAKLASLRERARSRLLARGPRALCHGARIELDDVGGILRRAVQDSPAVRADLEAEDRHAVAVARAVDPYRDAAPQDRRLEELVAETRGTRFAHPVDHSPAVGCEPIVLPDRGVLSVGRREIDRRAASVDRDAEQPVVRGPDSAEHDGRAVRGDLESPLQLQGAGTVRAAAHEPSAERDRRSVAIGPQTGERVPSHRRAHEVNDARPVGCDLGALRARRMQRHGSRTPVRRRAEEPVLVLDDRVGGEDDERSVLARRELVHIGTRRQVAAELDGSGAAVDRNAEEPRLERRARPVKSEHAPAVGRDAETAPESARG